MFLYDLLFPKQCLGCGKGNQYICHSCIEKMPKIRPECPECEKPSIDGYTHFNCKRAFGLDGLVSLWPYDGVVRKAILALKYKYAREIAKELSNFIQLKLTESNIVLPKSSALVPVPLYFLKENVRGFNQSILLGEFIAKQMDWGFFPDMLIRIKLKKPQTKLKQEERIKNIKGVFSLNPNYKPASTRGELLATSYILFDDVYTTGSTLKEACKVLKRRGAEEVWGLTIAR